MRQRNISSIVIGGIRIAIQRGIVHHKIVRAPLAPASPHGVGKIAGRNVMACRALAAR